MTYEEEIIQCLSDALHEIAELPVTNAQEQKINMIARSARLSYWAYEEYKRTAAKQGE